MMCTTSLYSGENKWVANYEKATKLASETKKKVFIVFTNSTRCIPCKKLKENIIGKEEFKKYAAENLILLKVDYAPSFNKENKKSLTEIEQGLKLPKKMAYRGRGPWPYLFIISPDGETLYSGKAYDKDRETVENYIKFLEKYN